LTIECDELWSFVGNKQNKQWVWLAFDRDSKEIVGVYIGDRSRESAQGLWDSLPGVYRQCAVSYTDFWEAYEEIFQPNGIVRWGKPVVKPIALSDLMVPCGNGYRDW
jgi:IS1 family transposase